MGCHSRITAAGRWLSWGFGLLPVQPHSKHLYATWGIHQNKITTLKQAAAWFEHKNNNMAVVAPPDAFILDFDDPCLYWDWLENVGDLGDTYTECTPRGGFHVFFYGCRLSAWQFIDGVEYKQVVVVYPSSFNGKIYQPGEGLIKSVNSMHVLNTLIKQGYQDDKPAAAQTRSVSTPGFLIKRIKQEFSIESVLIRFRGEYQLRYGHRYLTGKCPLHKGGQEEHPSFWIDTQLKIWGCHACKARGDVINLWAALRGIDLRQAIDDMRAQL